MLKQQRKETHTIMDKQKSIDTLQMLVTELSNGAFTHLVQSRVLASQGYTKLAEKFSAHSKEEYEWVEKFIDRILDLGGCVKVEDRKATNVICDPIEYMKVEYEKQKAGVDYLANCIGELQGDVTTYDLVKDYYKDEEEDQYDDETDLDLIKKLGEANWLLSQL